MNLDEIIRLALEEDLGSGDISTRFLELEPVSTHAFMIAKAEGVLAGVDVAKAVFLAVDRSLKITLYRKAGDRVAPRDEILRVEGRAASILQAERTALNFLQRMSGIATLTDSLAEKLKGSKARLLDTRKTTPLLRALEKYGHVVSVAQDGVEALEILERESVDLILMDLQMPRLGGLDATRMIREREKAGRARVPIVALTAHAMLKDKELCLEAGMDAYLAKPFQIQQLMNMVNHFAPGTQAAAPEPDQKPSQT